MFTYFESLRNFKSIRLMDFEKSCLNNFRQLRCIFQRGGHDYSKFIEWIDLKLNKLSKCTIIFNINGKLLEKSYCICHLRKICHNPCFFLSLTQKCFKRLLEGSPPTISQHGSVRDGLVHFFCGCAV